MLVEEQLRVTGRKYGSKKVKKKRDSSLDGKENFTQPSHCIMSSERLAGRGFANVALVVYMRTVP
jgi:hypothetical protein